MKKTLSLTMALLMFISIFSSFAMSTYAYPTMAEAPEVALGDTFTVTYGSKESDNYEYYAKFVPEETGIYEFVFAEGVGKISGEVDIYILTKAGKEVASDFMDNDFPEAVSVAAKLTKGVQYYLAIDGYRCGIYTSAVTIQKHTHKYETVNSPAMYFKEFDYVEDGGVYSLCEGCGDTKKLSTIYSPSKVTLSKSAYTYDGKAKKPAVTVTDRKGNKIPSSEYKVSYSNNKKVGTATVTITFKFDIDDYEKNPTKYKYAGEMTKTFKINPPSTSISKLKASSKGFKATWKKQTTQTTGYQLQYATDSAFKKNVKTVTISKSGTTSKSVSKLKGNKKYYVRVRTYKTVSGTKYYSAWSKAKTVTTKK